MLSIQDIKTVQSTLPLIEQAGAAVTEHFYTRMFTHNPELKDIFNLSNQHSGRQKLALFEAIVAYAKNLDNPAVLAHAIERIANKHVSFDIKADDYDIVGHHLIETMRELLSHHFTQAVEQAWGKAYGILANIFISREEQLYSQRASAIGGWRGKRAFQLAEKTQESELVTSFTFRPVDCQPVMDFQPGQYIAIELQPDTSEHIEIRQYSLSAKANGKDYRISVKREGDTQLGVVSNYLHNRLSVGDLVDLHAPTGDFFFTNKQQPVVLISAGVGITPMQSMLETLAHSQYAHPVTFIHACENQAQHSFAAHTAHLCEQHNWRHYTWYNQEQGNGQHTFAGFIDFSKIELPITDGEYYLCGPVAFMQFAKEKLQLLGIDEARIHYEVFGPHATL